MYFVKGWNVLEKNVIIFKIRHISQLGFENVYF